jgi:predicted dehydrogenase
VTRVNPLNRRQFLGAAAGALAITQLPARAAAPAANPRPVKLGLIGCGWWGMVVVKAAFKAGGAEVVALCDVDNEHLRQSAEEVEKLQGSRPSTFKRHEELLAAPGLEAVIIATPPQWHALQFIAALERGLDVYCEKPLAYDVREGQAMAAAAARSDRVVQIGFQRRQSPVLQEVRQLIEAGRIGRVVQAEAQIHYTVQPVSSQPESPPASLDWDRWCGPGPLLPYSPQVGHRHWRLEKAVGNGHLVDWGIHLIDATRVLLDLGAPRAVTAAGGIYHLRDRITTPDALVAHFEFERCPLTWRHRLWGAEEYTPELNNGITLYGDRGTLFVSDSKWVLIPAGRGAEREERELRADTSMLHAQEFLAAVRERRAPSCTAADAHVSTTAVQLAMIAFETGARIGWDHATGELTGPDAAERLLERDYRAPWRRPV